MVVMAKPLEMEMARVNADSARAMDVLTVIAKPTEMDTAGDMEATV